MAISINEGINHLPFEVLKRIHSHLPLEDQVFTMPKVSSLWGQISLDSKNDYNELLRYHLERSIKVADYSDEQIDLIIKLFKTNNFISWLKKANFSFHPSQSCSAGPLKITTQNDGQDLQVHHKGTKIHSPFFPIYWNPNNLNLSFDKGRWGDFRYWLAIRTGIESIYYQNINLFKSFTLIADNSYTTERGDLFSWKWVLEKEIKPLGMNRLIIHTLDLQLKMYVVHMARRNMFRLEHINDIDDINVELHFPCNKNGCIVSEADNENLILTLQIKNILVSGKNMPILTWKSSDYYNNGDSFFSYNIENFSKTTSVMSWSVFSLTCEMLAEKLGIGVRMVKEINR